MATPLTDSINALTTYANEVTGASDTTLSDAVHTLASGYGGDGTSSWTKVAETNYQVSTTKTTATEIAIWVTGHSEIWTSNKWVWVRVRDTAGKRAGYFYGSDSVIIISKDMSGTTSSAGIRSCIRFNSSSDYAVSVGSSSTGYGVYADMIYSDGRIRIKSRYSSTASLTIDGIYKVEVYLLDPAGGVPIFE